MHATEEYYNKINRIVLTILGLWPYQQSYFVGIQQVFFISIFLTFIFVQLLLFITMQYNTNLLLKILSFVLPILFCCIKYCIFIIQRDSVKQMLKQNRDDWKLVKDKLEIGIMEKYSYTARFFAIIFIGFCWFGIILFTIVQSLPLIFDIILPLNESRSCRLIFIAEYFVNQEKYIYTILLHHILAISVALITVCNVSFVFLMYLLHICALLNIASYRIENAMEWNMLAISSPTREYYQRIIHAVTIHRRAIEFTKFFTSEFTVLFGILIVVGVSSLSLNLLQLLQLKSLTNNITETLVYTFLICVHLTYMFIANYAGQIVTDQGIKLFRATYNGMWYKAPLHMQKILLFIMQKGTINVNVGFGNIYTASLEGFATLVNAAVSYFIVIYSSRE
ncbi:hypothetical protein ACFW04_000547 [Cataglyphis niger]